MHHQMNNIAMIHRMSRNIFQRDDVVNWNHVPEMCEEFADACGPMQLVYEMRLKFFKKPQRRTQRVGLDSSMAKRLVR